jgi:AcrR family transcriptional regulator
MKEMAFEPKRSDARRNRTAILAAARELFAERGFDAPLNEIARRACVGQGTLYRHFADRYALAAAIFCENVEVVEQRAAELGDDPGGFLELFTLIVDQQVQHDLLAPALMGWPDPVGLHDLGERVVAAFAQPVRAARDAGRLRADFTPVDAQRLIGMTHGLLAGTRPLAQRRERADRAIELLLHGVVPRDG